MVTLDLMDFIERCILPRYAAFDAAHNMGHAVRVIRASMKLAQAVGADEDMAYAIAAYHDLGLEGHRAIHHITGARIVRADKRLLAWFSPQQVNIIAEAVEDHRASASRAPRSIYGKIVAEADRDLEPQSVMMRTVLFGLDHYPQYDKEEHWRRFREHLMQKYSTAGYIKLWLHGTDNEKNLAELRRIILSPAELRKYFEEIYNTNANQHQHKD